MLRQCCNKCNQTTNQVTKIDINKNMYKREGYETNDVDIKMNKTTYSFANTRIQIKKLIFLS